MSTESRITALEAGHAQLVTGQAQLAKDQEALKAFVEEKIENINRQNVCSNH